ncbi:MAG TPA: DUF5709 domain-containing protein [Mycobacteriales bacterium]|nr:DUF5709 domain-containing protein [Mycobacteriales bacterium]
MTTTREPTTGLTAVPEEGVTSPADRPVAVLGYGTTTREQLVGEPLDGRLARELPDPTLDAIEAIETGAPDPGIGSDEDSVGVGTAQSGRLVEPDEGARTDAEADAIASDVGMDDGALSQEELAMHVVDEADAGLTDDPDGYVDASSDSE